MRTIPLTLGIALACVFATSASSQQRPRVQDKPLGARSLFPADYDTEVRVDVGRLEELGVLAEIQRSVAAVVLARFREAFGFPMDEVASLTYVSKRFLDRKAEDWVSPHSLWVYEGSDRVRLVDDRQILAGESASVIGGTTCVQSGGQGLISPRPGLLFHVESGANDESWLLPILRGEQRGGVAVAGLTELTTVRRALALVVAIAPKEVHRGSFLLPGLPDEALTPADPISASRLALLEQEDERQIIEIRLRFTNGKEGPDRLLRALTQYRETIVEEVELRTIANLLREIRITKDGADLVAVLDLGAGRAAVANLSRLLLVGVQGLIVGTAVQAQEIEVIEVEEVEEPPPPAPVEKKRDDG